MSAKKKEKKVEKCKEVIVFEHEWREKFDVGLIKVLSVNTNEDGYLYGNEDAFIGSSGVSICLGMFEWDRDEMILWIGNDEENSVVLIDGKENYNAVVIAINELNSKANENEDIGEIKSSLSQAMKEYGSELNELIDDLINEIDECENINEIMNEKRKFVLQLVGMYLPFTSELCPFCIKNMDKTTKILNCKSCEYGKEHGICNAVKSDYKKLMNAVEVLVRAIKDLY
jgi:hypothetical protein